MHWCFVEAYTPCESIADGNNVTTINYNKCSADVFGYSATGIPFNDAYRCELPPLSVLTCIDFRFGSVMGSLAVSLRRSADL